MNASEFRMSGRVWGLVGVLVLVVAGVFARGLWTQFVDLDDREYVFDNPHVDGGLTAENAAWAFRGDANAGFWIPLTFLSLQLDASLTGPERIPVAHPETRLADAYAPLRYAMVFKIQNLFWHIVGTVFLFLFVSRATGRTMAGFVLALLWAVHPLRVESVVWVTERKDVLAGAFGFMAMYMYVGWARRGGIVRYAGVCLAFALSLMAKPMCVTMPFALVLVDGWPLGRIQNARDVLRRVGEKWGLIVLSAGASVMAVIMQAQANAVNGLSNIGVGLRIENALVSYVAYIVRQVRVWDLAVYYTFDRQMPWWEYVGAGVILAAVTWGCIWMRRRRPWLVVGWLWFLGTLVPMIGFLQVGEQAYADRFSYFPAIGLMVMGVFTLFDPAAAISRQMRGAVVGAAAIFCVVFTVIQIGYWKDSITILSRTVELTRGNYLCYNALANAYLRQGDNDLAAEAFEQSVKANPEFGYSWISVAWLHYELGDFKDAAPEFYQAVRTMPRNERALFYYGASLYSLGKLEDAITTFKLCLRMKPEDRLAAKNLQMATEDLANERAATQQGTGGVGGVRPGELIRP